MPEEEDGEDKGETETEEREDKGETGTEEGEDKGDEGVEEMGEKQQAWESAGAASHEETTEMKVMRCTVLHYYIDATVGSSTALYNYTVM